MAEQRVITHHPLDPDGVPWHGRLDPDPRERTWPGPTIEKVIQHMDHELGPVPEADYQIEE